MGGQRKRRVGIRVRLLARLPGSVARRSRCAGRSCCNQPEGKQHVGSGCAIQSAESIAGRRAQRQRSAATREAATNCGRRRRKRWSRKLEAVLQQNRTPSRKIACAAVEDLSLDTIRTSARSCWKSCLVRRNRPQFMTAVLTTCGQYESPDVRSWCLRNGRKFSPSEQIASRSICCCVAAHGHSLWLQYLQKENVRITTLDPARFRGCRTTRRRRFVRSLASWADRA